MKVSVIVPVYNVEDYIQECIESLLNQTLKEIEIIIVNDGSKDNSIEKVNDLILNHDNIRLIDKENGGLSSARNAGLVEARGEYISFVDSDDYIAPNFLETLYVEAKKNDLDIAVGGYTKVVGKKRYTQLRIPKLNDLNVVSGIDFLETELKFNDYRMEVWDDLYKKDFLIQNALYFKEGYLHEDELFTPLAFIKASRVKMINTYEYMYRQRENSIMSKKPGISHISSYFKIIEEFLSLYKDTKDKKVKFIMSRILINLCGGYEAKILMSEIPNKKELLSKLQKKNIKEVLNYQNGLSIKQIFRYSLLDLNINLFYIYVALSNIKKAY